MPFTDKYVYYPEGSTLSYTAVPTNNLSVDRLVNGKSDVWIKPYGAPIQKKKKLVINRSVTDKIWNDTEKTIVSERLQQLQNEGSLVYSSEKGKLILLENIYDIVHSFDKRVSQLDDQQVVNLAITQQRLSGADEVFVFNKHELEILMEGDDSDWSMLTSFENVNLSKSNINTTSLNHLLRQKGNQIRILNLKGCINLGNSAVSMEGLSLPMLEEICISSFGDKRKNNLNEKAIGEIIASTQSLKRLYLSNISKSGLQRLINNTRLEHLEVFDLADSSADITSLSLLLAQAKNLHELDLSYCTIIGDISEVPPLESLRKINLSGGKISVKSLVSLLEQTKKLQELDLSGYSLKGDISEALPLESLKFLESFTVPRMKITASSLQKLLGMLKNLKTVDLSACTITGDISEAPPLESLETIYLPNGNITAKFLQILLEQAKNLRRLDLSGCTIIGDMSEALPFESLETINFQDGQITAKSLQRLLERAKNLRILDLSGCTITGDILEVLSFEFLEIIHLRHGNISAKSLQNMLLNTKNLKNLNLYGTNITGDISVLLPLGSLEEITFFEGDISAKSLQNVLGEAKNLKELNLSGRTIIGDISEVLPLESLRIINPAYAVDSTKVKTYAVDSIGHYM